MRDAMQVLATINVDQSLGRELVRHAHRSWQHRHRHDPQTRRGLLDQNYFKLKIRQTAVPETPLALFPALCSNAG